MISAVCIADAPNVRISQDSFDEICSSANSRKMQLPFMNNQVTFRYILLVLLGILVHSENDLDTETAIAGSSTNLSCHFAPTDSDYVVAWVLNDGDVMNHDSSKPLQHKDERRFPVVDQSGSEVYLEIFNVTFGDAGWYKCQRFFKKNGTAESRDKQLHVQGDIQIEVDKNVKLDDPITAACCVRSTKSVNGFPFVWYIDNVWSGHDQFEETVFMDSDMKYCRNTTITSVKRFHKHFLGCSISSELNITSKSPLNILYPVSVEWIHLTNTPTPIMVDRNQNVTITCFSDGNPSPSVLLQKETSKNQWMDLPFNETFWNVTDNYWKFSYNITEETTCALRCFATNDVGESSASEVISIEVFAKANIIVITSRDTSGNAAKGYDIFCLAKGIPPPDVRLQRLTEETEWRNQYVEEQQIGKTEEGRNVLWTFHIVDKQYRDDVTYRCIANNTNDVFAHSSSTTLTVTKFDLMAVILANLKVVVISCVGFLLLLMVICLLALKKRKRIRYRLSAEANRNATNSTQNQQNFIRRDMPDLCSHEPIASSRIDTPPQSRKEDYPLEQYQNFQVVDRTETATPDVPLAKFDDGASYGVVKKKRERAPKPELAVSRFDDGANYAVVKKKRIKKPMYKPPPRKVEEEYTNMKYRE